MGEDHDMYGRWDENGESNPFDGDADDDVIDLLDDVRGGDPSTRLERKASLPALAVGAFPLEDVRAVGSVLVSAPPAA